jgi:hypothetical protein
MSIKRLFDAVERRGDIGRRVAALVLPISNRPRVTSSCTGKIGLREPGEHTSGPNLASRDNVAHNHNLYTTLETPPPVIPLHPIRWSHAGPAASYSGRPDAATALVRIRSGLPRQSALILAARITLPHFSASAAMSLPKAAGEPASTAPPRSGRRALIVGSTRPAEDLGTSRWQLCGKDGRCWWHVH